MWRSPVSLHCDRFSFHWFLGGHVLTPLFSSGPLTVHQSHLLSAHCVLPTQPKSRNSFLVICIDRIFPAIRKKFTRENRTYSRWNYLSRYVSRIHGLLYSHRQPNGYNFWSLGWMISADGHCLHCLGRSPQLKLPGFLHWMFLFRMCWPGCYDIQIIPSILFKLCVTGTFPLALHRGSLIDLFGIHTIKFIPTQRFADLTYSIITLKIYFHEFVTSRFTDILWETNWQDRHVRRE